MIFVGCDCSCLSCFLLFEPVLAQQTWALPMHQEKHCTQSHRLSQWHSQQDPEIPASEFCLQEEFLSMLQQEKMCCINNWKPGQEYVLQKLVRPGDSRAQSKLFLALTRDGVSSTPSTFLMLRARKLTQPGRKGSKTDFRWCFVPLQDGPIV